jgi:hypothetical protein
MQQALRHVVGVNLISCQEQLLRTTTGLVSILLNKAIEDRESVRPAPMWLCSRAVGNPKPFEVRRQYKARKKTFLVTERKFSPQKTQREQALRRSRAAERIKYQVVAIYHARLKIWFLGW